MNKILYFIISFFSIIIYGSCNKFFDVQPSTTSVNPTTIADFEEILNSDSIANCDFFLMDLMSDDITLKQTAIDQFENFYKFDYYWSQNIWNAGDADISYNRAYTKILQMNIILDRIEGAKLDDSTSLDTKNSIKAQALINRAWYYLQLVNCYGKNYSTSTSNTDLGIPLVLKPDATNNPSRATVQEIYSQILTDLRLAAYTDGLDDFGTNLLHPGKAAAFGMLAKTYLCMANYDSALYYANKTLTIKDTIFSYASYTKPTKLYDLTKNPEVIMPRLCIEPNFYGIYGTSISMSNDLATYLTTTDYRRSKLFLSVLYTLVNASQLSFDYSLKTPEIYLIKAECLARNGNGVEAITLLNLLRKKRYSIFTALDVNSTNALKLVIDERRRELFYMGGLRIFDLKRLNTDPLFKKDLTRLDDTQKITIATLPAESPRYLMQFSPVLVGNNPNIIQNPR